MDDEKKTINKADKIQLLQTIRTESVLQLKEMRFTGITMDSLQKLLQKKPLQSLKLQCALPVQYSKDNKPQSGTTVELENVFNPVFVSNDVDSIDASTEKDINLLKLDISKSQQEQAAYYTEKQTLEFQLKLVEHNLTSSDLATREQATSEIVKRRTALQNLKPPNNNLIALQARLSFLQQQLHVRKRQMVDGYVSWKE